MGDGWEIENSSSEKAQSGHSTKTGHSVSQMRNSEGSSQELSKFDLDFKTTRRFSGRSDIAYFDAILLRDSKTASPLEDVKQDPVQNREERILISSCGFNGNILVKEKIYDSETGLEATTFEEEGEPLKMNSDMNMEREKMSGNTSLALKYPCSSLKDNENTEENNGSQRTDFNEKNTKDFSDLSLEGKNNGHGAVVSSREETVSSTAASSDKHGSKETNNSAEITQNKPPRLQEKDNSKRKIISFRALVRMKGLGRRIRKKHQITKKREKYSNHRNDSGQIKEMKSDSSAKYLLESSTSTSEEQTLTQMKISPRKEEPSYHCSRKLQRSQSFNPDYKDSIFPNSDELSCSSNENNCSSGYLERRRGAVCEELEKTLLCGEQSLADLRAILVVQQKLTGFGLL